MDKLEMMFIKHYVPNPLLVKKEVNFYNTRVIILYPLT